MSFDWTYKQTNKQTNKQTPQQTVSLFVFNIPKKNLNQWKQKICKINFIFIVYEEKMTEGRRKYSL